MKTNRLLMWLLAACLTGAAVDAAAQPRRGKGRRGMGQQRIMAQLNLTAEQQEKIKTLRLANAKKMARIQADAKVAGLELREVMDQDTPSAAEVKAKLKAVGDARSRMMESRVRMQLAVKEILTAEQRAKMKELRQQRPVGRGGRGGKGMRQGGRGWRGDCQACGKRLPPHSGS